MKRRSSSSSNNSSLVVVVVVVIVISCFPHRNTPLQTATKQAFYTPFQESRSLLLSLRVKNNNRRSLNPRIAGQATTRTMTTRGSNLKHEKGLRRAVEKNWGGGCVRFCLVRFEW